MIFVDKVLPQVTQSSSNGMAFISWSGNAMDSSHIGRSLQSLWRKAGLRDDITCTLFRKTVVSTVHQKCPSMKTQMSDLMCHRPETANRCYRLVDRQLTSVQASKTLTRLITAGDDNEQPHLADSEEEPGAMQADQQCSSDSSSSSTARHKLFSSAEVDVLVSSCEGIIKGGIMSKDRTEDALKDTELLETYTICQVITRLAES